MHRETIDKFELHQFLAQFSNFPAYVEFFLLDGLWDSQTSQISFFIISMTSRPRLSRRLRTTSSIICMRTMSSLKPVADGSPGV